MIQTPLEKLTSEFGESIDSVMIEDVFLNFEKNYQSARSYLLEMAKPSLDTFGQSQEQPEEQLNFKDFETAN